MRTLLTRRFSAPNPPNQHELQEIPDNVSLVICDLEEKHAGNLEWKRSNARRVDGTNQYQQ
jgi:hypothetical protein